MAAQASLRIPGCKTLADVEPIGYMSPKGYTGADMTSEKIEYMQRRRTRMARAQAVLFLIWQTNFVFLPVNLDAPRLVDQVRLGAYLFWAGVLMLFLATGGGYFKSREVRALLNDESTVEHRRRALSAGFWAAMAAAVVCYLAAMFEPYPPIYAIHAVLSAGLFAALMVFARLERRAQDG